VNADDDDAQQFNPADAVIRPADFRRVCRAWHRTNGVEVPMPSEFILSETEGLSRRIGEGQGRHR